MGRKRKQLIASGEFIAALISLVTVSIIGLYGIAAQEDMVTKQKLDSIARQYIIKIETNGNMTGAELSAMQNEVKQEIKNELGDKVKDGSISVVITPNTYGNNVSIQVDCKVKLKQNKFIDGFHMNTDEESQYVEYSREITSTSTK